MRQHRAALAVLLMSMAPAQARDRLDVLEQQLRDAQAQLAELKASKESEGKDRSAALAQIRRDSDNHYAEIKARLGKDPATTFDHGRLTFISPDGAFSLALRSTVQFDAGYFAQGRNPPGVDLNSGTNFRRAQLGFAGTLWRDWSYNFTYDFGGTGVEQRGYLYRAYIEYDGFRPFGIRLGAFAPSANVEDATGGANLLFLERPAAPTIARSLAGGSAREGIDIFAQGSRYLVSLAYTGGKTTDSATFDEQQGLVGRAAYLVADNDDWKWLLDANATHVFKLADTAPGPNPPHSVNLGTGPELGLDSTRTVETGSLSAHTVSTMGVETALLMGRAYGEAGWFHYTVEREALPDPQFSGWYAQAAFSLTGEPRRYDALTASFHNPEPDHPLESPGGFGAWEAAARFSRVNLDYRLDLRAATGRVTGGVQDVWSLGLNWYPSAGLKFMLDYDNITVRHAEARSQDISANAVAMRSQIVF